MSKTEEKSAAAAAAAAAASASACNETCSPMLESKSSSTRAIIYIATWSDVAPTLQAYVDAYQESQNNSNKTTSTVIKSDIRLAVFPTIRDLVAEITSDSQTLSSAYDRNERTTTRRNKEQEHLYDGFVIPPLATGELVQAQAVIRLNDIVQSNQPFWSDILPYYRNVLSSVGGDDEELRTIQFIPLFAGNQLLLTYRKDWLDRLNLPEPRTLSEFLRVAGTLHRLPLGPNGALIAGSCLGRPLSEQTCKSRLQPQPGCSIQSLSLSYMSMALASINQMDGSSSGWLFDTERRAELGRDVRSLQSLLRPGFERSLLFMEDQLRYVEQDQEIQDASHSLRRFLDGYCAMTITADHPMSLLTDNRIGIAPLPGSYRILNRSNRSLINCTVDKCPYGVQDEEWGTVNLAPLGVPDAVVGAVSSFASRLHQHVTKDFLQFIFTNPTLETAPIFREQPLTYSQLTTIDNARYRSLISGITRHDNMAYPLRIPKSLDLLTTLDAATREYLAAHNYSEQGRSRTRESVEFQWKATIDAHDAEPQAVPLSIFYEKSLGTFLPAAASNRYIGDSYRGLGWMAGLIVIATSLLLAGWVWWYRTERIVLRSQPLFLWMVCAGTLTMGLSIFLFGVEDDTATFEGASTACMASVWMYSIGFVTTVAALYAKTWRINQIFRVAHAYQRIKVEHHHVLLPFFIAFSLNLIILVIWNAVDPLKWKRLPLGGASSNQELQLKEIDTFGSCESNHKMGYFWVLFGVNSIFIVLALVQSYECRMITTEYNESLWIGWATTCIFQVWILGMPIMRVTDDMPRARYFVKTGVVFVTCMGTLLLLFFPKIGHLNAWLSKKAEKQVEELSEKIPPIPIQFSCSSEDLRLQRNMPLNKNSDDSLGGRQRISELSTGSYGMYFNSRLSCTNNSEEMLYSVNGSGSGSGGGGGGGGGIGDIVDSILRTSSSQLIGDGDGLRIIRSSSRRYSEIQEMQRTLGEADEKRRRLLQRMDTLKELMEHEELRQSLAIRKL